SLEDPKRPQVVSVVGEDGTTAADIRARQRPESARAAAPDDMTIEDDATADEEEAAATNEAADDAAAEDAVEGVEDE
ncbi:MAG: hypothetical protein WD359_05295, partial [Dehalococcoidia bacterium]